MTPLVDTHSHLFSEEFDEDRVEVLEACRQAGVERVLLPNLNVASLKRMNDLVAESEGLCLPMIGLHPTEFGDDYERELDILEQELRSRPDYYIAVGEIGLDYYWSTERKDQQKKVLRRQLEWAAELDLPVSLHARSATIDVVEAIKEIGEDRLRGVFHSFTDGADELVAILQLKNFKVGINGVVTFKKSNLPELIKSYLPIDRLVVETDSPYLAPVPKRGKRNDSSNLPIIVKYLCDIYNLPKEEMKIHLFSNYEQVFVKKNRNQGFCGA